jgi:hypothetical protein
MSLRIGNIAMRRMTKPSIVDTRNAAAKTPAFYKRWRNAAAPALVWVKTKIRFGPKCSAKVSAMR